MWGSIISGAISLAGSAMGGKQQSDAAAKSAEIQAEASQHAADLQNQQFNILVAREKENQRIQEQRLKPFADLGYNALTAMQYGMGIGGADYLPQTKENFDAEAFMKNLDEILANAPVAPSNTTVKGFSSLPKAEQDRLKDQYTRDKARYDYASTLRNSTATSPWEIYQKTILDKRTDFLPQNFWKKATIQEGQSSGSGGRFGFGNYGALLKKFGIEDFQQDPGYQFRKAEGMKGIQGTAAARGGLQSGATLKALNRYNQDLASNEYQNSYNRYIQDQANVYNRLAGVLGTGQTGTQQIINQGNSATANINQAGQNNAAAQANALMQGADARASGYMGAANAKSQMYGNIANNLGYMSYNAFSS